MCIKMFTEKIFGPESNKVRLKKEKQHQLISSSVTVVQSYTHLCFQIFKWPWMFHKPLIPSLDSAVLGNIYGCKQSIGFHNHGEGPYACLA